MPSRQPFNRHTYMRVRLPVVIALRKAVRQHKKRSHLRAQLQVLDTLWTNLMYGGYLNRATRTFKRLYRRTMDRDYYSDTIVIARTKPEDFAGAEFPVPFRFAK